MRVLYPVIFAVSIALSSTLCAASSLTPVDEPSTAPPMRARDLSGVDRSLEEFEGKVVVLNFWATWCPPCVKELPSMQSLWNRLKDREFAMIGVNVGEDAKTVEAFLASFETEIGFPIVVDADLQIVKKWPVFGLPTTFVIDRKGRLVSKAVGERDWSEPGIEDELIELIEGDGR